MLTGGAAPPAPLPAGAGALDKKARKQFGSAMLEQLGAKREKGPRISAVIGLGERPRLCESGGNAPTQAAAAPAARPLR